MLLAASMFLINKKGFLILSIFYYNLFQNASIFFQLNYSHLIQMGFIITGVKVFKKREERMIHV